MKKLIIIISLIFGMQVGLVFAGNDWLVREVKHSNKTGKGHSSHGNGFGFGHDREAFVLFRDGKIKSGNTETCGEVREPEDDWNITSYPVPDGATRPTLIKRAVEPDVGVAWDEYSDGSFDVFCYDSNGKLSQVTNTVTGLKNEFVYQDDLDLDLYIQYDNKSIDTYDENGRQDGYIYLSGEDLRVNRMIWNADYTDVEYQRGTEPTSEEITLYNQYF